MDPNPDFSHFSHKMHDYYSHFMDRYELAERSKHELPADVMAGFKDFQKETLSFSKPDQGGSLKAKKTAKKTAPAASKPTEDKKAKEHAEEQQMSSAAMAEGKKSEKLAETKKPMSLGLRASSRPVDESKLSKAERKAPRVKRGCVRCDAACGAARALRGRRR